MRVSRAARGYGIRSRCARRGSCRRPINGLARSSDGVADCVAAASSSCVLQHGPPRIEGTGGHVGHGSKPVCLQARNRCIALESSQTANTSVVADESSLLDTLRSEREPVERFSRFLD
ncbi:hypothetical protein DLM46_14500 [Paraburkholderia lacunae]|uniref:Uncharacterized protein n=1 Tax=Paraburkholderia lacunae TaxID=2211104 RepID=A0A370N953_9BURK|nr:hypothetical protein DLM46_14500 [Paraburkholderia lacunae]